MAATIAQKQNWINSNELFCCWCCRCVCRQNRKNSVAMRVYLPVWMCRRFQWNYESLMDVARLQTQCKRVTVSVPNARVKYNFMYRYSFLAAKHGAVGTVSRRCRRQPIINSLNCVWCATIIVFDCKMCQFMCQKKERTNENAVIFNRFLRICRAQNHEHAAAAPAWAMHASSTRPKLVIFV